MERGEVTSGTTGRHHGLLHAMLGLRAVLLDVGFAHRGQALITRGVVVLGAVTAGYSFWLIATLAAKS